MLSARAAEAVNNRRLPRSHKIAVTSTSRPTLVNCHDVKLKTRINGISESTYLCHAIVKSKQLTTHSHQLVQQSPTTGLYVNKNSPNIFRITSKI